MDHVPDSTFLQDLFLDIGIKLKNRAKTVAAESDSLLKPIESETGFKIASLSAPLEGTASAQSRKFEFQDRDLTGEEKNGAWLLGGLLGTAFLLGGLGKKGKASKEADHGEKGKAR